MATEHHTPKPPCTASTTPPRFPLDLRAINNAAADIWDIQHILATIISLHFRDIPNLPPDTLMRAGVLVRDLADTIEHGLEEVAS
jgi:hypothetical protein